MVEDSIDWMYYKEEFWSTTKLYRTRFELVKHLPPGYLTERWHSGKWFTSWEKIPVLDLVKDQGMCQVPGGDFIKIDEEEFQWLKIL